MANTTSDIMAQLFTDPATKIDVNQSHARLRVKRAQVAFAATESANHIFPLGRFQATDRIYSILLACDDLGTTLTLDVGVYPATDWSVADGTAIDADCLVNGTDAATAIAVQTEILGEGLATTTPELMGAKLHVAAGLADDDTNRPVAGTYYDVAALIATTATPLAGNAVFTILYAAGD